VDDGVNDGIRWLGVVSKSMCVGHHGRHSVEDGPGHEELWRTCVSGKTVGYLGISTTGKDGRKVLRRRGRANVWTKKL